MGYSSFDEVVPLVEKGLIGGVYIARHNIAGRTVEAMKSEIAALQDRRRIAGLPPLIGAADQEDTATLRDSERRRKRTLPAD